MSDVYQPMEGGPYPVILMRIPYDKTQSENLNYSHPAWYANKGYIVVSQDTRGRYRSEGEWYPFEYETDDGYDAIQWAASLSNSTGKVGMYGASYGGATQLLPARLQPPALAAICPAVTASQYFEGWTYNQGAFALAFVASWATQLGINSAQRRGDATALANYATGFAHAMDWHSFLPLNEHPPLKAGDTGYFFDWIAHSTYDDYWMRWSIDEGYGQMDVPALHIAGWYDVFLNGSVKNFVSLRNGAHSEKAREAQRLIIGPWFHVPWRPLTSESGERAAPSMVDDWQLLWFNQHLKGEGQALESPVTAYVLGEEKWRSFDKWPPLNSVATSWHLHSNGRANSKFGDGSLSLAYPDDEPPDIFLYDPSSPVPSLGGHSCCFESVAPIGPADQLRREELNTVLVYSSAPLENDLLLIGDVVLILFAATSAVDTDWTARFCQVDPAGHSTNLQEGIVRARFRESLSDPTLLEPNEVYEYEIVMGPVGILIPRGYMLRLQVSSSDFPQWDRNMNTGGPLGVESIVDSVVATQVVLHNKAYPSRLMLPIVEE
jgi:putative CocE/NonD family hydrolase